jgi:hypothetical protein
MAMQSNVEPKLNYVMFKCFMNMLSFDIILEKTCLSLYVVEKFSTLYIIYDDCVCMWYTCEHIYANYVKILLSNFFVY